MLLRLVILSYIGAALAAYMTIHLGWTFAVLAAPVGASLFTALISAVDMLTGVWPSRRRNGQGRQLGLDVEAEDLRTLNDWRSEQAPNLSLEEAAREVFSAAVRDLGKQPGP